MSDNSSGDFGSPGDFGGADSVTEVSTTGWLQRIGGGFVGALIGIVLVVGSVVLLWWNEGRAVEASRALAQGARLVVEVKADAVDPAAEGRLVHVTGLVDTRAPARDAAFGVGGDKLLRLKRTVEMYQWVEHKTTHSHKNFGGSETTETTYSYQKEWSERGVDPNHFHEASGHRNPSLPVSSATLDSTDARLGAYQIDRGLLSEVKAFAAFDPQPAGLPAGYRKTGDMLYRGQDEANPAIGDIRIRYTAVPSQTFSIVAAQQAGSLAPFHAANGYRIALADAGSVPAAGMFKEKAAEESVLTWIFRAVGFVLMLIGFWLMASPLAMLVAVVPFLTDLVQFGAFLVALIVAPPLTLFVIALAWIAHRPLVGIGLIATGVAAAYLLRRLLPRRRRPAAPPPAQPQPAQPQPAPAQSAPTHFLPVDLPAPPSPSGLGPGAAPPKWPGQVRP